MPTLYHNPKCSKSRAALEYLITKDISFNIIEYITEPLNKNKLKEICKKLNLKPFNIIRIQDQKFIDLNIKNIQLKNDDFCLDILVRHPNILERPIYETINSATIGRPLDNIITLTNILDKNI